MLHIAGQTAGPIGLNFFVDIHCWPGGVIGLQIIPNVFFKYFLCLKCFFKTFFFPRATPGPSTSNIYFSNYFWNRTRKVIYRYPQLKIINFVRETYGCLMHS